MSLKSRIQAWWKRVLEQARPKPPPPAPKKDPPEPPKPAPLPETPPAPPTPPTSNGADAIDIRGARLLGPHARRGDPANATVIPFLAGARFDRGKLMLDYPSFPPWPNADGIAGVCARNFLYWRRGDGVLTGGHFEWSTAGRRDRLLKNIHAGYLGEQPPAGAPCWTCTVRNNWTERSNVVAVGEWPG